MIAATWRLALRRKLRFSRRQQDSRPEYLRVIADKLRPSHVHLQISDEQVVADGMDFPLTMKIRGFGEDEINDTACFLASLHDRIVLTKEGERKP